MDERDVNKTKQRIVNSVKKKTNYSQCLYHAYIFPRALSYEMTKS